MKWLLILLLPITAIGQQMHGYKSYFNAKLHIPDSVIYTTCPHVKKAKRLAGFHGTPNISHYYLHSGYDIGHFANAEDMDYSDSSEYDSFNFINVAPQLPNLNRITWLALENYIRGLNQSVRVKISWTGIKGNIGPVTVPATFVKEIWYSGHYERYVMPNNDTVNRHPFGYYRKSPHD